MGLTHAILGNCGTLVAFRVGVSDSEMLAAQLGGDIQPRDLQSVPRFRAYTRLLVDGTPHCFSMASLPPPDGNERRAAIVERVAQKRYGRNERQVAAEIAREFQLHHTP